MCVPAAMQSGAVVVVVVAVVVVIDAGVASCGAGVRELGLLDARDVVDGVDGLFGFGDAADFDGGGGEALRLTSADMTPAAPAVIASATSVDLMGMVDPFDPFGRGDASTCEAEETTPI